MRHNGHYIALAASVALVSGCSSGQSKIEPGFTSTDLNASKAQLAVGVATFVDGSKGLNAVATFRQPNGRSGTLANTPTITGPTGFVVPAGFGVDSGTSHISGSPQVPAALTAVSSTFGTSGGVFLYGLAPDNSTTAGSLNYGVFDGAFYDAAGTLTGATSAPAPVEFRGGPPSYPNVLDGTYPSGFPGFTQGFTTFATPPVAGSYAFSVAIASSNVAPATIVGAPGMLTNLAGLGAIAAPPTFVEDGAGGGSVACTVPAGTTEVLVDLTDVTAGTYFSSVVHAAGAIATTFAPNLGAFASGVAGRTIGASDEYSVSCLAVDYPAFEAGPPTNIAQTPTLAGANGQADISFSPNLDVASYGGPAPASAVRRHAAFRARH